MIERIVVGTDGSESADLAVEHAIELARRFEAVLHVVSAYGGSREEADGILDAATEQAKGAGLDAEPIPVEGDAAIAILDEADKLGADLIVVGNKGMKGARRFLGSVPSNVAHNAPCGVYIVHTAD